MTLNLDLFRMGMARMAVAFDVKADDARTAVYWEELSDLGDEAFAVAVKRALREWDKPFALPTLRFLRERADQASGVASTDEALGQLRRKICYRYAPTRPDAELTPDEAALVHELGQTPARLALMPPKDLDWWLRQSYGPAWSRSLGQRQGGDALLGTAHRAALGDNATESRSVAPGSAEYADTSPSATRTIRGALTPAGGAA